MDDELYEEFDRETSGHVRPYDQGAKDLVEWLAAGVVRHGWDYAVIDRRMTHVGELHNLTQKISQKDQVRRNSLPEDQYPTKAACAVMDALAKGSEGRGAASYAVAQAWYRSDYAIPFRK